MENKHVIEVTTQVEELKDFNWLSIEHSDGRIDFVEGIDKIVEAADLWGMTPAGVRAMMYALDRMAEYFANAMREDLVDVWNVAQCAHEQISNLLDDGNDNCDLDDNDF